MQGAPSSTRAPFEVLRAGMEPELAPSPKVLGGSWDRHPDPARGGGGTSAFGGVRLAGLLALWISDNSNSPPPRQSLSKGGGRDGGRGGPHHAGCVGFENIPLLLLKCSLFSRHGNHPSDGALRVS